MKQFNNLTSNLRAFFGFLRLMTIVTGLFAILGVILELVILPAPGAGQSGGVNVTMGEVALQVDPAASELNIPGTQPRVMTLQSMRATLLARPGSPDPALRSAILQCTLPSMLVAAVTAYVLFTTLRQLCGNWEEGDMFSEENVRLVRRIGLTLVISSLVNALLILWSSAVVGNFLHTHVNIGHGLKLIEFGGQIPFTPPAGIMSVPCGLVVGCLVLALTAAFRQGLKLKAENDLTV